MDSRKLIKKINKIGPERDAPVLMRMADGTLEEVVSVIWDSANGLILSAVKIKQADVDAKNEGYSGEG